MKKIVLLGLVLALSCVAVAAKESTQKKMGKKMPTDYRTVPFSKATIVQTSDTKLYCPKCGMTLTKFYKTNHSAIVDGNIKQFCSIHCLVEAMSSKATVTDAKVIDNATLQFIDTNKATYVIGSSKPATMSKVSKYAFGSQDDAKNFVKKFGGSLASFEEVLDSVKKGLSKEQEMIKTKQAKAAIKGKMMYKNICKSIETKFHSTAEAKAYLTDHQPCGKINSKQMQAIGLYLSLRDKQ